MCERTKQQLCRTCLKHSLLYVEPLCSSSLPPVKWMHPNAPECLLQACSMLQLVGCTPRGCFLMISAVFDSSAVSSGQACQTRVNSVPVKTGGVHFCLCVPAGGKQTDAIHMLWAPLGEGKDLPAEGSFELASLPLSMFCCVPILVILILKCVCCIYLSVNNWLRYTFLLSAHSWARMVYLITAKQS